MTVAESKMQDEEVKTSAQERKKKEKVQSQHCSSIKTASTMELINDLPGTTSVAPPLLLPISPTQGSHNFLPSLIICPDSPSNLRQHAGASAQILLRVLKDACDILHQVPYVKIVAGLVQEIIKISEVCVTF